MQFVVRIGLTLILFGLAVYDWRRERVPNVVALPLLLAAIALNGMRLIVGELTEGQGALLVLTWAGCLGLWWMRALGGGDAKLVMALIGLFPEGKLLVMLVGVLLIGHVIILLGREGRRGLRRLGALALNSLQGAVPTRSEIRAAYQSRRNPITFLISLAGLAYLWLFWGGGPNA